MMDVIEQSRFALEEARSGRFGAAETAHKTLTAELNMDSADSEGVLREALRQAAKDHLRAASTCDLAHHERDAGLTKSDRSRAYAMRQSALRASEHALAATLEAEAARLTGSPTPKGMESVWP